MKDCTDRKEFDEEVDHDTDNFDCAKRAVRKLKARLFFLSLTLSFSVFINAILIIKYKL